MPRASGDSRSDRPLRCTDSHSPISRSVQVALRIEMPARVAQPKEPFA